MSTGYADSTGYANSTVQIASTARASAAHAVSDGALIGRIAAGEKFAMQVLFGRHHVRVYRFVLRFLRDHMLAEDVTNEVFLDVWRQADRFEARSAVSTWLLAIARFKALSALKRRPNEGVDETALAAVEDPADDPEVAIRKRDRGEVLRRCLKALSHEHREVIDLVYYHEKSAKEVAQIMRIPEETVRTRMFYARKRLSELLAGAGVDSAAA